MNAEKLNRKDIHVTRANGLYAIYHANSGKIFTTSNKIGEMLEYFENGENLKKACNKFGILDNELEEINKFFEGLSNSSAKLSRAEPSTKLTRLAILVSQNCNLRCTYCYAGDGKYGEEANFLMTPETAKNLIYRLYDIYPNGIEDIQFFGGEPLLNLPAIKYICELVINICNERNMDRPRLWLTTNGTLIDEEYTRIANHYGILTALSLDGPKHINDAQRINKHGRGTYDEIISAVALLKKKGMPIVVEATIGDAHIDSYSTGKAIDILKFFREMGIDNLHIVPEITTKKMKPENLAKLIQYYEEMIDYCLDSLMTDEPFVFSKLGEYLLNIVKNKSRDYLCFAGTSMLAADTSGSFYPCFLFVSYDEFRLAQKDDFNSALFNKNLQQFRENFIENISNCNKCWLRHICTNCLGAAYICHDSIDRPHELLCLLAKTIANKSIAWLADKKSDDIAWSLLRKKYGHN